MGNKQGGKTGSTELTAKHIALLKANTKYTEKEIREWHAGFLRDCPNGKLDKKKFVEVYKQFYPHGKADNFCKYAFDTFDADHNGTIDFEEFLLAVSATSQGDLDERLSVAFDMYDISNDGQIDQKELTKLISAMYDLVGETDRKGDKDPKHRAHDIISKLDVSGDKKLNKQEFISGCKADPVIRRILAPNA
jgi:Ca2+-binding EF-hand superfamily protein